MSIKGPSCGAKLVLLSAGILLAACSSPGTSATAASSPSVEPTVTVVPSESATTVVPTQTSTSEVPTPEPTIAQPPAASIGVEGGDPVVGQLGTFTWDNAGSDGPWLDGSPIRVGSGEQLTFTLAAPVGIDSWRVGRVEPGNRDGIGAVWMAAGSGEPVTFEAPPAGQWSVEVSVAFAENRGSALYFWRIDVD